MFLLVVHGKVHIIRDVSFTRREGAKQQHEYRPGTCIYTLGKKEKR